MPLTKIWDAAITTMLILVLSAIAQPARSDDDVGKKTATPPRTEGRNTAASVDGDALANGTQSYREDPAPAIERRAQSAAGDSS